MGPSMRSNYWGLFGRWLIATLMAWLLGIIAAIVLSYAIVSPILHKDTNLIVGLVLGSTVGLLQMISVRPVLYLTPRWMWGATVGMGIPFIIAVAVDEVMLGGALTSETMLVPVALTGGVLTGLIQAPVLGLHTPRSKWWTLASMVSWGAAWLFSIILNGFGLIFGGLVLGALSGAFLISLLKFPLTHDTSKKPL